MKTVEIKGSLRTDLGKKATKSLRKEGLVPGVLYGGENNVHFSTPANALNKIVITPNVYLLKLDIEGTVYNAIIKDQQFHPVSGDVLHMDFFQIFEEKPVTIAVPVTMEGFAKGVQKGGKLQLNSRRLKVKALMKDLPDSLTVDVTDIDLGKTLKVGELNFENIELLDPASNVVAAVKLTRAARGAMLAAQGEGEGEE